MVRDAAAPPPASPAYPAFSWSHSRQRTLDACARRYYWHYYGAHNGWARGAPGEAALAYRLKHLVPLPLAVGLEVHARARELALAVRGRRPPPSLEMLRTRSRSALNALWRRSRRRTFVDALPPGAPLLLERYYGTGPGTEALEQAAHRLERCLAALVACALWPELAAVPPGDVVVFDDPVAFDLDGVRVYATPDVAYRTRGEWTIVDWKTGRASAAVGEQLAVYALALALGLGLRAGPHGWVGRVFDLAAGTDVWYDLSDGDLDGAAARIRDGVSRMRGLLEEADANRPRSKHHFAFTEHRALCGQCAFLEACRAEADFDALGTRASADLPVTGPAIRSGDRPGDQPGGSAPVPGATA